MASVEPDQNVLLPSLSLTVLRHMIVHGFSKFHAIIEALVRPLLYYTGCQYYSKSQGHAMYI